MKNAILLLSMIMVVMFAVGYAEPVDCPPEPGSFVLVEAGTFVMGDTWGTGFDREKPTHRVTLTYNYYIGRNVVTFDEYDRFCEETGRTKPDDEGWGRGQRPVINVSWWDAVDYCNWLSNKEGLPRVYDDEGNLLDANGRVTADPSKVFGYRLPTEAEWEFAARGGNCSKGYEYAGSENIDDVAWYWRNSGDNYLTGDWDRDRIAPNNGRTQEVGTKLANELGIHDMSGNVWEWCSDWHAEYTSEAKTNPYNPTAGPFLARVMRGGSCYHRETFVRVTYRSDYSPTNSYFNIGFRIARTVQ